MLKDTHIYRRIVVPIALTAILLFAFAPAAFATSSSSALTELACRPKATLPGAG